MDFKRRTLVVTLMLVIFLAAVEGTIVTLATPTIAKDLQGLELISLVFSMYLLTSAISTPVYGKFADLYGRKRILSIGIVIFLFGSALCGLSQNMLMLIIFRAVQGIGAGAILTVPHTIIGDLFCLEERSKIQGALNAVWGFASLAGPFLGGLIIDVLSWHWIFFINIPFGLLSLILIQNTMQENIKKKKQIIDYPGIVTLSLAVITFMSIFLFNENLGTYFYPYIVVAIMVTIFLLLVFYKIEKVSKEPMLPLDILSKSSVMINMITFLVFGVLIGVEVYLPIFLQSVQGYRPTISGLAILPMNISWLIISILLGRLLIKYGGKTVLMVFIAVLAVSTFLFSTMGISTPIVFVLIYSFVIGIAFGGTATTTIILVQESTNYTKRGTAVATNTLLRTLGQTIGISIFGSIFNLNITKYFSRLGITDINPNNLYQASGTVTKVTAEQITLSLNSAIHVLFIVFIIISCLAFTLSAIMPKPSLEIKR